MFLINQNEGMLRGILITALITGLFIIGADRVSAQRPSKTPAKTGTGKAAPAPTPAKPTTPAIEAPKIGTVKKNSLGMEFMFIPAGTFMMGSAEDLPWETPRRNITFASAWWMGKHEVTQENYQTIMAANPSGFKNCPKCPVESVSWDDAQEFVLKLNAKKDGFTYRLPTEAEWEYTARAGTTTYTAFGDTWTSTQANFNASGSLFKGTPKGVFLNKTVSVGSYPANAWGVCDMHGNVSEWVEDVFGRYSQMTGPLDGSANKIPLGIGDEGWRAFRGGSWADAGNEVRSANRFGMPRTTRGLNFGFRIVAIPN